MDGRISESRTSTVARWAADVTYRDFPGDTTKYAKALLLKTITGMIAGSREPISKILNTYFAEQGGAPDAGVVAGGFRTSVENAAYANATFAHASELEDNELPSITSAYWMFPALFPLAQKQVSTGKEVIESAIIAWEVAARYCRAAPGWMYMQVHLCPPTWFGPIGVAAAASKLLKLDARRTEHAMTIAGSWACGLGQAGCDTHFLESGHTAKMGLQSALLAKAGATGELGILEQPNGLFSPVAQFGKTDVSMIDRGLGEEPYMIHDACIKKYSACTYSHTSIDALGLIIKDNGLKYDDIERVETQISRIANVAVGQKPNPVDLQEARFSVQYLLAEVMLEGGVSATSFTDTNTLTDPAREAAKAKVRVSVNPEFQPAAPNGEVKVVTKGGREFVKRLDSWLGSPEHPLGTEGIRQVCRPYLETMLSSADCDRIEELVLNLEKQPDVLEIMDILTFARVGRRN
jgi:2-methylcitrate dehydratase PrpD